MWAETGRRFARYLVVYCAFFISQPKATGSIKVSPELHHHCEWLKDVVMQAAHEPFTPTIPPNFFFYQNQTGDSIYGFPEVEILTFNYSSSIRVISFIFWNGANIHHTSKFGLKCTDFSWNEDFCSLRFLLKKIKGLEGWIQGPK